MLLLHPLLPPLLLLAQNSHLPLLQPPAHSVHQLLHQHQHRMLFLCPVAQQPWRQQQPLVRPQQQKWPL